MEYERAYFKKKNKKEKEEDEEDKNINREKRTGWLARWE